MCYQAVDPFSEINVLRRMKRNHVRICAPLQ